MATATFTAAHINATDTDFRTWGKGLSDALAAVGFVKTTDTGQVDWSTVAVPAGGSYVYEIWRFNDTLQATTPIFFKVAYGKSAPFATPAVQITVGKGSNGSGTITSIFHSPVTQEGTSPTATPYQCFVSSGDGSLLAVAMWAAGGSSSISMYFSLERSRNTSGVATNTGFVITRHSQMAVYVYSTGTAFFTGGIPSPFLSTAGLASGGTAPMFPALLMDGQGRYWQPRAFLWAVLSDAAMAVPVTVSGGWGTYLPCWATIPANNYIGAIAWF